MFINRSTFGFWRSKFGFKTGTPDSQRQQPGEPHRFTMMITHYWSSLYTKFFMIAIQFSIYQVYYWHQVPPSTRYFWAPGTRGHQVHQGPWSRVPGAPGWLDWTQWTSGPPGSPSSAMETDVPTFKSDFYSRNLSIFFKFGNSLSMQVTIADS